MKEFVHIYTNKSKERLIDALAARSGDKQSALEHATDRAKADLLKSTFARNVEESKHKEKATKNHSAASKEDKTKSKEIRQSQKVNFRKGFSR